MFPKASNLESKKVTTPSPKKKTPIWVNMNVVKLVNGKSLNIKMWVFEYNQI